MTRRRHGLALVAAPLLFLAAFYAWPLSQTLRAATGDAFAWLTTPYVQGRLGGALLQALLSVALTLALAIPLAWLHHARRVPMGRLQLALHGAPFVMPVFVVVYGLQGTLGGALSAGGPLVAVVVAHAYYNYGFAARLIHASLERRPRRLEEAAQTLGASRLAAFARTSLPLLLPSLGAVALLVFLFTFGSFGTVLLLGEGEVSTPETMLYQNLAGAFPRPERAAALGALQLALNVALYLGYVALLRRTQGLARDPQAKAPKAGATTSALAWGTVAIALAPLAAVLVGAFRVGDAWTLEAWRALVDADHPAHAAGFDLRRAVALSLLYAAASTLVAVAMTLALAYGARSIGGRWRTAAEALAALPIGTSSLLLGFGFALAFGAGALVDLRGSALLIVLAHALVSFPFLARLLLPALAAHDARLDEAAALLGARPMSVVARVHTPLLAPVVLAACGFAAAMSLGDFGASLLLMRTDNMALGVWIHRHDRPFDPLGHAQAVALSAVLMLLAIAAYAAFEALRPREEPA